MNKIEYAVKTLDGNVLAGGLVEKGRITLHEFVPPLVVGSYNCGDYVNHGFAEHDLTAFGPEHEFIHRRINLQKKHGDPGKKFYIKASFKRKEEQMLTVELKPV